MIRITSRTEGFRRCGVAHTTQGKDWPDDAWSKAQLARLEADPMLVVQRLEDAEEDADKDTTSSSSSSTTTRASPPARKSTKQSAATAKAATGKTTGGADAS